MRTEPIMPWEDAGEFRSLVEDLTIQFGTKGEDGDQLVEDLAGILWQRERLHLGEGLCSLQNSLGIQVIKVFDRH